jgi:hypothetical protein
MLDPPPGAGRRFCRCGAASGAAVRVQLVRVAGVPEPLWVAVCDGCRLDVEGLPEEGPEVTGWSGQAVADARGGSA